MVSVPLREREQRKQTQLGKELSKDEFQLESSFSLIPCSLWSTNYDTELALPWGKGPAFYISMSVPGCMKGHITSWERKLAFCQQQFSREGSSYDSLAAITPNSWWMGVPVWYCGSGWGTNSVPYYTQKFGDMT